jgi:hypothetical protein
MDTFKGHKFWLGAVVGIVAWHFLGPIVMGAVGARTQPSGN